MSAVMKKIISLCLFLSAFFVAYTNAAQTINLYTWRQQEVPLWQFINEHNLIDGVTIKTHIIDYESYQAHIKLNIHAQKADLFQWAPGAAQLAPLIESGVIDEFKGSLTRMNKSALIAARGSDNKLYGVPFAVQLQGLLVNHSLLKKLNLNTQPANINELESIFKALKKNNITPLTIAGGANWYRSQLLAEVLLAGIVPTSFTEQLADGKACFSHPDYLATLELMAKWRDNGWLNENAATATYSQASQAIAFNQTAFLIDGGWQMSPNSAIRKIDKNVELGFWPLPGKSNKLYALGDGSYLVNQQSPRYQAANKVLKFTATRQFAELFANNVNELPAYGEKLAISDHNLASMAKLVQNQSYSHGLFSDSRLQGSDKSYKNIVSEALLAVLQNSQSPKNAVKYMQKQLSVFQVEPARCMEK